MTKKEKKSEEEIVEQSFEKVICAMYLRVSTEDQIEHYWIWIQLNSITNFISKSNNLELAEGIFRYEDLWISWTKRYLQRSELRRLFNDYESAPSQHKPFKAIVVYKLDRLARSLSVLLEIVEKCKTLGIALISVSEQIDTSSPFWNAMLSIMWVFAELEKNMIRDRMKAWRELSLENWVRQRELYWYRRNQAKKPEVYEEEAKVVRDIFEWYIHWVKIADIAKRLKQQTVLKPWESLKKGLQTGKSAWNKEEKTRKNSKTWPYDRNYNTINTILQNEEYIGKHYYNKSEFDNRSWVKHSDVRTQINKDERIESKHPHMSIISPDKFARAQEKLSEPNPRKTAKKPYILTWKLKCDCCRDMSTQWIVWRRANPTKDKRYYSCSAKQKMKDKDSNKYQHHCPTLSIPSDDIERLVITHIKRIITNPQIIDNYLGSQKFFDSRRDQIEEDMKACIKTIDRLELSISNNIKMCDAGIKDYESCKKEIENKSVLKDKERIKIDKYRQMLSQEESVDSYKKALGVLKESFWTNINTILDDQEKGRELIWYLVKEIIIYSRPRKETDNLRWTKRENQYVPYRIRIILNLPQEFLDSMMTIPNDDEEIEEPNNNSYDKKNVSNWDEVQDKNWDIVTDDKLGINKFNS